MCSEIQKEKKKVNGSTYLKYSTPPSALYLYFPTCLHMMFFAITHPQALLQHCLSVALETRQRISLPPGSAHPKQSCICLVAAYTPILATAMLSANTHPNSQLWSFIQMILWQFPDAHLLIIKPSHSLMYCLQPSSTEILLLGRQFGLIK